LSLQGTKLAAGQEVFSLVDSDHMQVISSCMNSCKTGKGAYPEIFQKIRLQAVAPQEKSWRQKYLSRNPSMDFRYYT